MCSSFLALDPSFHLVSFLFCCRASFNISYSESPLAIHSVAFCTSVKLWFPLHFCNVFLLGTEILVNSFFPFSTLTMLFHCLLPLFLTINLLPCLIFVLYITRFPALSITPLATFKVWFFFFFKSLALGNLIVMSFDAVFFKFLFLGLHRVA